MEISQIIPHVESLIFAADRPLPMLELVDLLNNALAFLEDRATLDQVETAVEAIREKYLSEFYAFEVRESGGGYQFLTKKDYYQTVAQLNGEKFLKRLSTAALETLAIIAYKQPISKGEIEHIRGVSSDYSIQKLLEKELIVISGRSEELPGKPLLYSTSKAFMDYFGLNSPADLPKLREVFDEETMIQPTLITDEAFTDNNGVLMVSENGELLEDAFIPTVNIIDEAAHTDTVTEVPPVDIAADEDTDVEATTDDEPVADTEADDEVTTPDIEAIGPGPGDDEVEDVEEDDLHEDLGDDEDEEEEDEDEEEDLDEDDDDEEDFDEDEDEEDEDDDDDNEEDDEDEDEEDEGDDDEADDEDEDEDFDDEDEDFDEEDEDEEDEDDDNKK
ncbi:MAG TPA: SMC-Scp complex subunit ScpB [Chitinophaga sp.]|uniref:SMC-Scp complex subunit ScpB n=1 Tax=Chitinophaga sp. TaxID=1869181 RepID=UPI002F95F690